MTSVASDKRKSPRRRTLKGAKIAYAGRSISLPCVIKDASDHGVRLRVQSERDVPDTFELFVELDGMEAPCRVVWRRDTEVGVQFVEEPSFKYPKKPQLPGASRPAAEPSLPRSEPENARKPENSETPSPALGSPARDFWIMVAEDDPDDQMLLGDAFNESGYEGALKFFSDGQELLDFIQNDESCPYRSKPGIIVLDLNMPRLDGRETLKILKSNPDTRKIPVVVMTTSNAENDVDSTFEWGVSLYLTKPSRFDALKEMVEALKVYWSGVAQMPARSPTGIALKKSA